MTHLQNAAKALERILATRHPEHTFVIEERKLADPVRLVPPLARNDARSEGQNLHPLRKRNPRPSAPGASDHHGLKKSA